MTFKIKPDPTFKATVKILAHGGGELDLVIVFKHKSREEMADYFERNKKKDRLAIDALLEIIESWEADQAFSKEAATALLENYQGAYPAIISTFINEIAQARLGN